MIGAKKSVRTLKRSFPSFSVISRYQRAQDDNYIDLVLQPTQNLEVTDSEKRGGLLVLLD